MVDLVVARSGRDAPVTERMKRRWVQVLAGALAAVVVVFAVLGTLAVYVRARSDVIGAFPGDQILQQQFILDQENNIPTWFSSGLLALSAAMAALLAIADRNRTDNRRRYWWALAGLLLVLSMDETASLHETFSSSLQQGLGVGGVLHFGWLVAAIPLVLAAGLFFLRFVLRLPPRVRTLIVVAGLFYLLGAVGAEMIGGVVWENVGPESAAYGALTTVEELLEMVGLVILIYGLGLHIDSTIESIVIEPADVVS